MSYFIFNGIDSRQYGILEKLPLDIRSERTTQIIDMPYGTPVVYQSPAYKSQKITVNLGLKDTSAAHLSEINQWLSGYHNLIFSDDLNRHYKAVCNGVLNGERMVRQLGKLPVTFTVMPFKYDNVTSYETVQLSSLNQVSNIAYINGVGTAPSEPLIKIYGNGNFNMDINDGKSFFQFFSVSEYIVIDVEARKIYDKNNNCINDNVIVKGSLGELTLYNNKSLRVVIDKTVTKFEINKKSRWL